MSELNEGELKKQTKAQIIHGFLSFKRKVNKETKVIYIQPQPYILFTIFSSLQVLKSEIEELENGNKEQQVYILKI